MVEVTFHPVMKEMMEWGSRQVTAAHSDSASALPGTRAQERDLIVHFGPRARAMGTPQVARVCKHNVISPVGMICLQYYWVAVEVLKG